MTKYHRKRPAVYLTIEEIEKMQDDELVGVNGTAISIRIAKLQLQRSMDKEAIEILLKAQNELMEREKKVKISLWGVKMTVKDVKKAFGKNIELSKTTFRKIKE